MKICALWKRRLGILAAIFSAWASPVRAADITTPSGRILKDVVFLMADPEAVMIRHDGGTIEKWPLSDMPPEVQKAYRYDPVKAATFKKDREIAELKKQLAQAKRDAPAAVQATPAPAERHRPRRETRRSRAAGSFRSKKSPPIIRQTGSQLIRSIAESASGSQEASPILKKIRCPESSTSS